MGKKIGNAKQEKLPYFIVVGDKEVIVLRQFYRILYRLIVKVDRKMDIEVDRH